MKIKVYLVDFRPPRWLRRALGFGAVPLVALGVSALVYASAVTGQPDFNDGDVLTATALNAHLGALQDQINALNTSGSLAPVGSIMMYGGSIAPAGWLLCDGSPVSRTTYAALLAAIGVQYGSGDGLATFNIPDLRQRFPLGLAPSGTGSTLGGTGGAIDHAHGFLPAGTVSQPIFTGSVGTTDSGGVDHTHSGPSHSHDLQNHTHGPGSLLFQTAQQAPDTSHCCPNGVAMSFYNGAGNPVQVMWGTNGYNGNGGNTTIFTSLTSETFYTSAGSGATGVPSTNTTGYAGTGTTSGSSAYLHTHGFTSDGTVSQPAFTGSGGTTTSGNPPFVVVNYIIKY